jgi:PAS domain S-box-containing protein
VRLFALEPGAWLFSVAVGALAIVAAALVLLGWRLDLGSLKSVIEGSPTMTPNTALCLLLLGTALVATVDACWPRRSRRLRTAITRVCVAITLLISGLTLAQHLGTGTLGIDTWVFRDELLALTTPYPGRMSPAASLSVAMLSLALLLIDARALIGRRISQGLTLISIVVPSIATLGYLYAAPALYEFKPFSTMALHTALILQLLGAGVLFARPTRAIVNELLSAHHGGVMARRILPFAVGIPVIVGWLRIAGQHQGHFGTEVGVALFAASNAFLLSMLVWFTARLLNRLDADRRTADYQAVQALRAAECRWRALVEASAQIVWTADANGVPVEDSPSWRAFTGQSLQQARDGRFEAIHPEDQARVNAEWRHAVTAHLPLEIEYRLRHVSGGWRWTSARVVPLRSADGSITNWIGMNVDITEHKLAEALAEGQKRVLEMIARDAPLNETLEMLARLIDSQCEDTLCSILLLDPDGQHLRHGAAPGLPVEYTRAIDGAQIGPTAGSCGTAAFLRRAVFVEDVSTDPLWEDYKHLALAHGLRACWSTPIVDAEGGVFGTFAIYYRRPALPSEEHVKLIGLATQTAAICLTRHRAVRDRKRLQESQLRSQKLEALGTLSGGIAHDFNNMLLVITGNAQLAASQLSEGHAVHSALTEIMQASARATDLVRRILAFSRPQSTRHKQIDLRPVIAEALKLVRSTLPAMIQIRSNVPADIPIVAADSTQIHQILVNLATNAAHAIDSQGGVIDVQLESLEVTAQMAAFGPDLRPGGYVRLTVRDTGAGMSPEVMARIFDPFFTTKPLGQGTGLGLSIVHGIMQSCGGAVRVQSELGKGTSFHLYFPALPDATASDLTGQHQALPGGGQHILLIDDEDSLVRLGTIMLTKQGYRVTGCTDPLAAVKLFRRQPNEFHAVVTDLSMPGMSGFDCARELLETRPDVPIVLTSGYVRAEDEARARDVGIRAVVTKPSALDQLPEILAQMFSATG